MVLFRFLLVGAAFREGGVRLTRRKAGGTDTDGDSAPASHLTVIVWIQSGRPSRGFSRICYGKKNIPKLVFL